MVIIDHGAELVFTSYRAPVPGNNLHLFNFQKENISLFQSIDDPHKVQPSGFKQNAYISVADPAVAPPPPPYF